MESALQKAIYDALLGAGLTHVYDAVPTPSAAEDASAFAYTVIGELDATPFHTDDSQGGDFVVTLEHASRYSGRKEVKQRMATARRALDQAELTVTGFVFVLCDWIDDDVQPVERDDGKTYTALQRFRVLLDQTG